MEYLKISKYLDTFMWQKGGPRFGTNFLKWHESSLDNTPIGGDWSTSGVESDYGTPNENNRRPQIGQDKPKKIKEEDNLKKEEEQFLLLHHQTLVLEKGVEQLNKHTEMFLKQQNAGMNKFLELEAMKYASESDKKEHFKELSKRTILTEKN